MTQTLERTRTVISYQATCDHPECLEMCWRMHRKLDTANYSTGVSLMPVPESVEAWRVEHRTARKRADRATRLGYHFARVDLSQHNNDIYAIHTSKEIRQGRPMSPGYLTRPNHGPLPEYPCDRHYIRTYGVLQGDVLRAYVSLYRLGELALVSMILGHGDYLTDGIMYLLFRGVIEDQAGQGGWFYYSWHNGGKDDDLKFYKERQGFYASDVEWVLQ